MPGEDDHRQGGAAFVEMLLHLQPVDFRHADVEQDAAGLDVPQLTEERCARRPEAHGIARRLQHEPDRVPDAVLVVDDVHQAPTVHLNYSILVQTTWQVQIERAAHW
jgi:hypothetical protein